jgi:putative ABC transport system permease protein
VPYAQEAATGLAARVTFAVRSAGDPAGAVAALRSAVRDVDPGLALYNVLGAETLYADTLAPRALATQLLGGFAGFGLLVATLGLYGVLSYAVVRRTHEIGIRMALGATPRQILRDVLQRGGTLVVLGAGVGLLAAAALARLLQRVMGPMALDDPLPFTAALAALATAALLACAAPARRAARADPTISLRHE